MTFLVKVCLKITVIAIRCPVTQCNIRQFITQYFYFLWYICSFFAKNTVDDVALVAAFGRGKEQSGFS